MKKLLLLLLVALVFCCEARPHRRITPKSPPRKPIKEYVQKVNWKHIAAGGAAAGTVVAAYKISDGVQEGMERAAKEDPETFLDNFSSFLSPVKFLFYGLAAILLAWVSIPIIKKYKRKDKNESHDQQK
ncbi:MAG: hypothetical protein IJW23_13620 [Lentisphaeria bacterium]|nr:hypothetical protein [Lentisphaeria bacterium]